MLHCALSIVASSTKFPTLALANYRWIKRRTLPCLQQASCSTGERKQAGRSLATPPTLDPDNGIVNESYLASTTDKEEKCCGGARCRGEKEFSSLIRTRSAFLLWSTCWKMQDSTQPQPGT